MSRQPRGALLSDAVATLPTSSFAFVMATGIVSSAMTGVGQRGLSDGLIVIAATAGLVLAALTALRVAGHHDRVVADARDPSKAFGYFTIVAAINVVGVDLYSRAPTATVVLAFLSVPLWALFSYGLPAGFILGSERAAVANRLDGSWFLWVVGTQSLAVAAATVGASGHSRIYGDVAVALWGVGVLLYLMLATLVTLRLLASPGEPNSLNPSYWIYMGATAITVLAGSTILALPAELPIMLATSAVVSGLTYVLWAFGMWWVPLLVVFGISRHVVHRHPLSYETGQWSIVFPLGMFAVASMHFGAVAKLPYLHTVGQWGAWIALACWLLVAVGMGRTAIRWVAHVDVDVRDVD